MTFYEIFHIETKVLFSTISSLQQEIIAARDVLSEINSNPIEVDRVIAFRTSGLADALGRSIEWKTLALAKIDNLTWAGPGVWRNHSISEFRPGGSLFEHFNNFMLIGKGWENVLKTESPIISAALNR